MSARRPSRPVSLVVRLDNAGDVLLAGPAVRAVAAGSRRVVLACSSAARPAAALLPGVDDVVTFDAPWVLADPGPVDPAAVDGFVAAVARHRVDRAVVLTSFHQSALPVALLLRLAGVPFIGAISEDYPGSLLDVRHHVAEGTHEVMRARAVAEACGFPLPEGDDGRLRAALPPPSRALARLRRSLPARYVVVHPGASVPARTWAPEHFAAAIGALAAAGRAVVVTGSAAERPLARRVVAGAGAAASRGGAAHGVALGVDGGALGADDDGDADPVVVDVAGALGLADLAHLLAGADALVVGNTGPAHLAAAVGTPVVSLFAPTVPVAAWHPWGVPAVVLGDGSVPCAGCRARVCPVAGQPCLAGVTADDVVAAVGALASVGDGLAAVPGGTGRGAGAGVAGAVLAGPASSAGRPA